MTNRDFTIDMKMQADFARAKRECEDTQAVIDGMDASAVKAGKSMDGLGQDVSTAAKSMSGYTRAAVATQQAVQQEIALIGQLQSRLQAGASSWEELADTETMLDRAMSKGLVTAEEYDDALASLNKSHASLTKSSAAEQRTLDGAVSRYDKVAAKLSKIDKDERTLRSAVESGRISREQYNRAMADLTGQRASLKNLGQQEKAVRRLAISQQELRTGLAYTASQALRGDLTGAGTSLLGLGTRSVAGFGALTAAIAGGTLVLGTFLAAVYSGQDQLNDFEKALLSAGGAAGVTSGQLQEMAGELGDATGRYGDAEKSLRALAASGVVTSESLKLAAQAALDLSELTGDSIEQTTQKVIELAKSPTKSMQELNQQYRFLTVEVYEHVRALEDQGKTTEAAQAALEQFGQVHRQRVLEAERQAGSLVKAWNKVKSAVSGTWQFMSTYLASIGSNDVGARLANLQKDLDVSLWASDGKETDRIKRLRKEIAGLQKELQDVRDLAAGNAYASDLKQEWVDAARETADAMDGTKTKAEQLAGAVDKVRKRYQLLRDAAENSGRDDPLLADVVFGADGSVSGGGYDKEIAALNKQFAETQKKSGKSDADKSNDAAKQELQDLGRKVALLGQVADGETKVSEAARIGYEITSGKYKDASEAMKSQLVDAAQLYDSQKLITESEKNMATWQAQINALRGLSTPPEMDEATQQLQAQQKALESIGHTTEAAKIGELLGLTQASKELAALRQQYDQLMGQADMQVQQIQAEQQVGLITQTEAQQKIVDLYQTQAATLRQLVPQMRAAAGALGDPQALANVEQIELKLQEMEAATNRLQQTVKSTFTSAFSDAAMSLITASDSLSEAVSNFFLQIAQGIAQMYVDDWAQQLGSWASNLVGNGTDTAAATTQATAAAATETAATSLGVAGTTVSTGAAALGTSATSLATAGSTLIPGAAAVQTAATQLQAAAASMAAASAASSASAAGGFATGGLITGPGTGTSDSIPIWASNGEFMARSRVMRQPGALRFMTDFNRRGMAAVRNWGRYAKGGQITARRAAVSTVPDNAAAMQSAQAKNMRLYLLQDQDQLVQALASHPVFEQAVVATASRNGSTIKAEW